MPRITAFGPLGPTPTVSGRLLFSEPPLNLPLLTLTVQAARGLVVRTGMQDGDLANGILDLTFDDVLPDTGIVWLPDPKLLQFAGGRYVVNSQFRYGRDPVTHGWIALTQTTGTHIRVDLSDPIALIGPSGDFLARDCNGPAAVDTAVMTDPVTLDFELSRPLVGNFTFGFLNPSRMEYADNRPFAGPLQTPLYVALP